MIRQEDGEWVLRSQDGEKVLGKFATKEEAEEREAEIERIQHAKAEGSEAPRFLITLGDVGLGLVRIPLVRLGRWFKGALKFAITRADLGDLVKNFRKRAIGETVINYEHPDPELAAGQPIPAAGWLKAMEDQPDGQGVLWGEAELTDRAREMIRAREYKYLSPEISWAARDKDTGAPQGATLGAMGLVNRPFLDMPAIALSEDWREDKEEPAMAEETKVKQEGGGAPATEPKVIRLSDVKRGAEGRLDFAGIEMGADVVIASEVLTAMEVQRELDGAVKAGKIKPVQRPYLERLTLSEIQGFLAGQSAQVDLSEHGFAGSGGAGGQSELKQIDQRMRGEIDKKRAADKDLSMGDALVLVASEHPDWAERRRVLQLNETGREA